jgi:mono/diheme cytochrome c family protein
LLKISKLAPVALAVAGLAGYSGAALAANAGGKALFEEICSECHETADFEGEDAKEVGATIKKIKAGEQKHKAKITLSDSEIKELADFLAQGGK